MKKCADQFHYYHTGDVRCGCGLALNRIQTPPPQMLEETQMVMFKADLGLAIVLESEDIECRGDEDCDHCVLVECHKQVKEWLDKYGSK